VALKVDRWVCEDDPIYKKMACGGNVSGVIKRSEFGMKYSIPSNSDEVRLSGMFLGFRD
jgi:polyisoprenoid-binding protein YceI